MAALQGKKARLEKENEGLKAERRRHKGLNASVCGLNASMKGSLLGSFGKWDESEKLKVGEH